MNNKAFAPHRLLMKAVLAAVLASSTLPAHASHHFEVAIARTNTAISQLDNYVFQAASPGRTVIIMNVNSSPRHGATFSPNALYNIHVALDDKFKEGHTFSFQFRDGQVMAYLSDNPNGRVGETGVDIGKGKVGGSVNLKDKIELWTGIIKDPFYGNSSGLGAYSAQLKAGKYDPQVWKSASGTNIFKDQECGAIVLEIPNEMLGKNIKVFMTTALKENGKWSQVQYSANPLLSHVMYFEDEAVRVEHDRSRPNTQSVLKNFVSASTARASGIAQTQAQPFAYGDKVADALIPDVLNYEAGSKAGYSADVRNGRYLDDDAMSAMLTLLIGKPTDQAIDNPKLYTDQFPYVIPSDKK